MHAATVYRDHTVHYQTYKLQAHENTHVIDILCVSDRCGEKLWWEERHENDKRKCKQEESFHNINTYEH